MSLFFKLGMLGLLLSGAMYYCWKLFGVDGVTDQKATYAAMQGVELFYRDKVIAPPFLVEQNGLRLLAIPSEDEKFPYIWIALNRKSPTDLDGVYKVGAGRPKKISCAKIASVFDQPGISESAKAFLRTNCSENDF
ncbi:MULTISPECIES: hypothetical protein [Methylosinus]|uniref:Uncharacterized protein n=1 Tax=Methylosinus trichosporium (strain ATCC 35070 / NCIMB 11131 / UNIQEM 75 / OB3b) TaxID=595536 RepID=A0A2D2CVJ1_METT3|nr:MULTISPECIES: hypothetical protein [Methylosinus]ATQ66730.1 hypothetical protein CQW49_01580 [Methylosinus trichosporium OB3b]OBS53397.1 hypothetical protein A8B73_06390 [Methylosinus sp. 3S-1]